MSKDHYFSASYSSMFTTGLASAIISKISPEGDDDLVDRLNYFYSVGLIILFAVFVSARHYVGRPIQCWVPPQFSHSMEEYIESYCWMQNTYWLPLHANIPDEIKARENLQIGYYQWTPLILGLQALFFYLPAAIWKIGSWQAGVNMRTLVSRALCASDVTTNQERKVAVENLAQNLEDILNMQSLFYPWRHASTFHFRGCLLNLLYLFIKTLYTFNVIAQFFVLNYLLCPKRVGLYGVEVLSDLIAGLEWTESGHFPRVTLCDFEVKYLGNLNRYTVQCALIGNLFNEKIFALLWCWYCAVAVITFCSWIYWILNTLFKTRRNKFVKRYLEILADRTNDLNAITSIELKSGTSCPDYLCDRFVRRYLKCDGVFILRRLASNAGDLVCMEVTQVLWLKFLHNEYDLQKEQEMSSSTPNRLILNEVITLFDKSANLDETRETDKLTRSV